MWRNSAGVLVCVPSSVLSKHKMKNVLKNERAEILFVKRSNKAGFMAGVQALPGGHLDEADYSSKWLRIFGSPEKFTSLLSNSKLPIYTSWTCKYIPAEVAYRICAIRELFEETGILLARKTTDEGNHRSDNWFKSVFALYDDVLSNWRNIVRDDPSTFVDMCRQLNCVPDIFSMVEWSNWLTPFNSKRRYDTIFYLVSLEEKPHVLSPDLTEVSELIWHTSQDAINLQFKGQIMLAPPQLCDVSRFNTSVCMDLFTHQSSLQQNVTIRIRDITGNGYLAIGQGDDLYPTINQTTRPPNDFAYSVNLSKDTIFLKLSDNASFEYDCLSHSTKELHLLSSRLNRVYGLFSGMTFHNSI